jgi:hypothetical protein
MASKVLAQYGKYASHFAFKSEVVVSGTTESNVQITVPQ